MCAHQECQEVIFAGSGIIQQDPTREDKRKRQLEKRGRHKQISVTSKNDKINSV